MFKDKIEITLKKTSKIKKKTLLRFSPQNIHKSPSPPQKKNTKNFSNNKKVFPKKIPKLDKTYPMTLFGVFFVTLKGFGLCIIWGDFCF
jgi:hypothetical protein